MTANEIEFPLGWAPVRPGLPSLWDRSLVDRRRVRRPLDPRWRRAGALAVSGLVHGLIGLCVMMAGPSPPPYRPAEAAIQMGPVRPWVVVHPLVLPPQITRAKPISGRVHDVATIVAITAGPPGPPAAAEAASNGLWAAPFRTVLGQAKSAVRGGVGCAHVDVTQLPAFERAFCRSPPTQPYIAPDWRPRQLYNLTPGAKAPQAAGQQAAPATNAAAKGPSK
jgi:hypothetical protein